MPLRRFDKLPPPPEMGERTIWQLLPRQSVRRVLFLLLALGAVLFIKSTGGGSFGQLLNSVAPPSANQGPRSRGTGTEDSLPVYHLKVTRPPDAPDGKSHP
jgi:hypothetical protein